MEAMHGFADGIGSTARLIPNDDERGDGMPAEQEVARTARRYIFGTKDEYAVPRSGFMGGLYDMRPYMALQA
jgi:hypothetical protein